MYVSKYAGKQPATDNRLLYVRYVFVRLAILYFQYDLEIPIFLLYDLFLDEYELKKVSDQCGDKDYINQNSLRILLLFHSLFTLETNLLLCWSQRKTKMQCFYIAYLLFSCSGLISCLSVVATLLLSKLILRQYRNTNQVYYH